MKLRLFSPRLLLRLVRAVERIAVALEDIRDASFKIAHIPTPVRDTDDPDSPEDSLVSYTSDRATFDLQQRDARKRRDGFPSDADEPPRA